MIRINNKGDTIIEVLITVIIVSSALVGAITISNYGTKQIRMAQERTEAQKFAQQEVERLDRAIEMHRATLLSTTALTSLCINSDYSLNLTPPCRYGTPDRYEVTISRDTPASSNLPKTFTVTVEWDSLKGGTEQVRIPYRSRLSL